MEILLFLSIVFILLKLLGALTWGWLAVLSPALMLVIVYYITNYLIHKG